MQEVKKKAIRRLLSCPFCGGMAHLINYHYCVDMQFDDDHDEFYCMCSKCHAQSQVFEVLNARYRKTCKSELKKTEERAISAWNRRPNGQQE